MARQRGSTIPKAARDKFLERVAAGDAITNACRAANIGRSTVYGLRVTDEEFAARWDEAVESGTDAIEQKAVDLALDGEVKLIMFLLRGRRRSVYGEKVEVNAKVEAVTSAELAAARAAAEQNPEAMAALARSLAVGLNP